MNMGDGKWRVLSRIILIAGLASLAGCGGGGSSSSDSSGFNNPSSAVTIQDFSITGNQPSSVPMPQINSANPAPFFVNWRITGNNVYTAHVFVSADATLDVNNDIEILVGCGKTTPVAPCLTSPVVYPCSLSSSSGNPTVLCNNLATGALASANLSSLLPGGWTLGSSPAYIILQACNQASGACPASSLSSSPIAVRFY